MLTLKPFQNELIKALSSDSQGNCFSFLLGCNAVNNVHQWRQRSADGQREGAGGILICLTMLLIIKHHFF